MKNYSSLKNFIYKNYLFIIIIPLVIIIFIVSGITFKYLRLEIINKNKIMSENISSSIDSYLNESLNILKYSDSIIEKNSKDINLLKGILTNYKIFKKIEVLNKNGVIINSFPKQDSKAEVGSNEEYSKAALQHKVYWSGEAIEYPGNKYIIIGYLDLNNIKNYINDLNSSGLKISLTDNKGNYILNNTGISDIRGIIKNGNRTFIYKENSMKKLILSCCSVKISGWYVITGNLYYPSLKNIFVLITVIALLLIILLSAISFILYSKAVIVEKSFDRLCSQTNVAANVNFPKKIIMDSFSEFNYLADNINCMISELSERGNSLKRMAYYDSLTGLPNKTNLISQLEKYYCSKPSKCFGILYIDIDDLRRINDTYGHKAGDSVLTQFSERLNNMTDDRVSCFRLGGDEFILLIKGIEGRLELETDVKYIISKFENPFKYDGKEIFFSVSIGAAIYPKDSDDYNELLQYADTAMYAAKKQGKNNYKFFTGKMRDEVKKKLDIERNLRRAISKNEFILYYQPQIDINNTSIKGFEALIRWNNGEMGFINPAEFISICEETNMIIPISNWIIGEACKTIKKINREYEENYTISINISPTQLMYENFIPELKDIIDKTEINPQLIELEITENVLINSYNEVLEILYKIKDIGVKISLDDFGTGYSSFSYLKSLPIDFLKIDKTFVNNIDKDNKDLKLIRSIINMAHDLNIRVIAEGIETISQLDYIEKNNCDIVQGFVYSRPVPENLLDDYIIKFKKEVNYAIS